MKNSYTVLVLLLLTKAAFSNVTIKGKIANYDGVSKVLINCPIQGVRHPYTNELIPNSNGNFIYEFENNGFGISALFFRGIRFNFFHHSNSKISIEIDQNKIVELKKVKSKGGSGNYKLIDSIRRISLVKISGDFEKINKYYNTLIRTAYSTTRSVSGNYYTLTIRKAKTPAATKLMIDSLIQREQGVLDNVFTALNNEKADLNILNSEAKSFLQNEINSFYGSVFLGAMFTRKVDQYVKNLKDSISERSIYNKEWQKLIEEFFEASKKTIRPATASFDYNDLIESLCYTKQNFKRYDFPQSPTTSLDEEIYNSIFKLDSTILSDSLARFQFQLNKINRYLNDQLYYSPVLLSTFYILQNTYPKAVHFKRYEPLVQKLKDYIKSSQSKFDGAKIITKEYKTLKELLAAVKGVPILIDIWATWCHPCIEEFNYRPKLQPLLNDKKLVVLYISTDLKEWASRWRENIKFNQLEGIHYRADKDFIKEMWKELKGFEGAIPRYALVDSKGEIYMATASKPSDGDKLEKEIGQLLTMK